MKVNVLGTEYEIILDATPENYPIIGKNDGCVDFTTKKIYISEMEVTNDTWQDIEVYKQTTIRHEVVHAFLQESGLAHNSEWGRDETLVDWIALQFPKIAKVIEGLEQKDEQVTETVIAFGNEYIVNANN